jgi:hypothetical protein
MALLLALVLALVPAASLAEPAPDPLAGPWTMTVGSAANGAHARSVGMPHVVNATGFTGRRGEVSYEGAIAWFRKRFTVPATGPYALAFGSVHHKATIWIDGRVVKRHTGAYLPFDVRATLAAGRTHTLLVRADYRDPLAMKHSGWHRSWFNFGGINRPVTLRAAGPSDIVAPNIRTRLANGAAIVDVSARIHNHAATRTITITGSLGGAALSFPAVTVPAGGARAAARRASRPVGARPPSAPGPAAAGRGRGLLAGPRRAARDPPHRLAHPPERQAARLARRVDPGGRPRSR